jgi:transcriptional regulator with XRE-family HTH domain
MSTTTTPLAESIGARIRTRRRATDGMSVTDLAKAAGISRQALTRVELGQQLPTIETLVALAEALDCEAADLLPTRKPRSAP